MAYECPKDYCERTFDTKRGAAIHKSKGHNNPWNNPEVLKEMYVDEHMSTYDIADELGCSAVRIQKALDEHGFEKRVNTDYDKVTSPSTTVAFKQHKRGYEEIQAANGEESPDKVYVHRLLAVAEYGVDKVAGNHVHHKNGVQWDNRIENLEVLSSTEHGELHSKFSDGDEKTIAYLYLNSDLRHKDLADLLGVSIRSTKKYTTKYRDDVQKGGEIGKGIVENIVEKVRQANE